MVTGFNAVIVPAPQIRNEPFFLLTDASELRERVEHRAFSLMVWKSLTLSPGPLEFWIESLSEEESSKLLQDCGFIVAEGFSSKEALQRTTASFLPFKKRALSRTDANVFEKVAQEMIYAALSTICRASYTDVDSKGASCLVWTAPGDPRATTLEWGGEYKLEIVNTFAGEQSFFVGVYTGEVDEISSEKAQTTIQALLFLKQVGVFNWPFEHKTKL